MIEQYLRGQNALITGASKGIGAGCAIEFAKRGANVGINFHSSKNEAAKVQAACVAQGVQARMYRADVADPEQVSRMCAEFCREFGALDILVANAGIQIDKPFVELSADDWQQVVATNLTGQFLAAQAAARIFLQQGVREGVSLAAGKILHMSSVHEKIPWAGHCNYAASKGGIKLLMESAALELAEHRIRINALAPGAVETSINEEVWQNAKRREELLHIIPYQRVGRVAEIAAMAAWLCSDYADYITGTTLFADGGMTLYPSFKSNG